MSHVRQDTVTQRQGSIRVNVRTYANAFTGREKPSIRPRPIIGNGAPCRTGGPFNLLFWVWLAASQSDLVATADVITTDSVRKARRLICPRHPHWKLLPTTRNRANSHACSDKGIPPKAQGYKHCNNIPVRPPSVYHGTPLDDSGGRQSCTC